MDEFLKETIATYDVVANEYKAIRQGASCIDEMRRLVRTSPGSVILDAGCGPGRDTFELRNMGCAAYGIDLSEEFLIIAKNYSGGDYFAKMDLRESAFANETFDAIWCCAVLSHLKKNELVLALKEFGRIVKDGGKIFFAVKKGDGEGMQKEDEFPNSPRRYMSYFNDEEVLRAVGEAGLITLDQYYYNELHRHGGNHRNIDYIFNFSEKVFKGQKNPPRLMK